METMRVLTPEDVPALMRLKEAAGWNQTEEDWLRLLRLQPDGCFGCVVDDTLAASATVINYGDKLSWIGMVLTLPEFRGQGLARKMMARAVEFAGGRRIELDASDSGKPLYESMGFVAECAIERWVRIGGPSPKTPQFPRAVSRWMKQTDAEAAQADRTALLAELAASGFTELRERGWAFGRPGSNAFYFGPAIADNAATAQQLGSWCTSLHGGEAIAWDLFPDNGMVKQIAVENGFSPARRLTRMVLGKFPVRLPDPKRLAIAGFEYG